MMNTKSTPTDLQSNFPPESLKDTAEVLSEIVQAEEEIALPEPDPDNITVLTDKLPDTPILPWNHYDSPWREVEGDEERENGEREPEGRDRELTEAEAGETSPLTEPEVVIAAELTEEPEIDEVE